MARTIFVTKTKVENSINAEADIRRAKDILIDQDISLYAGKISTNVTDIGTLTTGLSEERNLRLAQIGNLSFPNLLTSEGTSPNNLTEAINAVVLSKETIATKLEAVDVEGYELLMSDIETIKSNVNKDKATLESILLASNIDYNSFAEIIALISAKDAETAADIAALEGRINLLLADKMDKVQTSESTLEYIDVNDPSKKYKIVIVDGQLAVDEVL